MVGRVAADALNRAGITADLLAQQNLDPVRLAEHVMEGVKPGMEFNEQTQTLYSRIVSESCQHIVDIASSLPGFTERSFGEVLKREDDLRKIGLEVLEGVRELRERVERENPEAKAARFEADYRRSITWQLDQVQIFGVDVARTSQRQKLSVAYISLSVEESRAQERPPEEMLATEEAASEDEEPEDTTVVLPIEEALAETNRTLIRGEAGSGKTTLLQWIAVQSAQAGFQGPLQEWNDTIPFFIRLRHFHESDIGTNCSCLPWPASKLPWS